MLELIPTLVPFLLVDALNPVLFALMIVAVGTSKPIANSGALLAGHTAAYFVSGVALAFGLEKFGARFADPKPIDFVIELIIGVLCLWAAVASRNGKASEERGPESELSPAACFGYGAIVNLIGVPFAVPYLAAIDQLLKADLALGQSLLVLALYNIAYALPFLLVPVLTVVMGEASKPILQKINNFLVSATDRFMPLLLFVLGAALIADSVKYLATGQALW